MKDRLKILSIGAGAIGTYIGGSLALRGHGVVFVERPEIAAILNLRGLKLRIGEDERHVPHPRVVTSIAGALKIEDFDVALYALKSFDTASFIQSNKSLSAPLPPILCLSNGVDNEPTLETAFGPGKVIAGTVTSAIGRQDAGDIVLERLRGVGVAACHSLSERLVAAMEDAGLNGRLFLNASDMKWSKMLTNLIANATSAILDMSPAEIFAHPGLYRLEITQLRETLAVMSAQGIKAVDLPKTPVRLLALTVRSLPASLSRPLIAKAIGGGRGSKMPSFHIDLHTGRGKSEVDFLNGAVLRAGAQFKIRTPANKVLNETLVGLTNGEIPLDTYRHQPQALLSRFEVFKRQVDMNNLHL
jgi:2-dehydropantoate 2-reductase